MLRIAIIIGSTRPGRKSLAVGKWVHASASGFEDAQFDLVDLAEIDLPFLDESRPAAFGPPYRSAHTRRWAQTIASYDGFLFVVPEYNHSIPGVLKNALDYLYDEWHDKVAACVSYGVDNGARAVLHLRTILNELGVASIAPVVGLSLDEFADGEVAPAESREIELDALLTKLLGWTRALASSRVSRSSDGDGATRPAAALGDQTAAQIAARAIIEDLQSGLDTSDAERYNLHFTADVLWGSPYGATLQGYDAIHSVHRAMEKESPVGPSRYELVRAIQVSPDVIMAQVKRAPLADADTTHQRHFAEMALYVLVRRGDNWWLAAGQNTVIDPDRT